MDDIFVIICLGNVVKLMLMHSDVVKHPIGVFGSSMLPEVLCAVSHAPALASSRGAGAAGRGASERGLPDVRWDKQWSLVVREWHSTGGADVPMSSVRDLSIKSDSHSHLGDSNTPFFALYAEACAVSWEGMSL